MIGTAWVRWSGSSLTSIKAQSRKRHLSKRIEYRGEGHLHRAEAARLLVTASSRLVELLPTLTRRQQPTNKLTDMPHVLLEIVLTSRKYRVRQIWFRDDAGTLPEALQNHPRPFEISQPISVDVEHNLRSLSERTINPGRGAAIIPVGQRNILTRVDADETIL